MPILPGDVGAVAALLNTLAMWALDPAGLKQLTRDQKLEKLKNGLLVALDANAFDAADLIFAELRRMHESGGA
jgi:hypothetical protein